MNQRKIMTMMIRKEHTKDSQEKENQKKKDAKLQSLVSYDGVSRR
jgi:hypothetical protein